MNSLRLELNQINEKIELLTYRKQQLDSIMAEYSDVVNRVKNLVDSMQDAMVEPSNLLTEIEGIIFNVQPELTPIENLINEQSEHIEEQPTVEPLYGVDCSMFDDDDDDEQEPTLNNLGLPIQTSTPEHIKRYPGNIYWDNGSGVRVFIPKKRRYKGELEAIAKDCIKQGHSSKFEIVECDADWLTMFSHVTSESSVQGIIDNFYPKHTDGEPEPTPEPTPQPTSNPELVKLMALVPTVATEPTPKTQLNERAWQRNNTLLIGFTNKKLLKIWSKWFIENWGDSLFISDDSLEEFSHCLSILWYKNANWERLKALDYSQSPDNQELIKTPDFEFKKATETTIQIFRDGVLLGLAKNCDGHWESPQFKGEQFDSIEDIASRMWELINQF